MPQVAVALLKVGFFVFEAFAGAAAAATLGAGAAVAIGAAVVVGGTLVAKRMMSLFEVEIPTVDSDASRQRTVRSTIEPQKIVYGEALVSGPISFIGLSGTDNSDLYQTIVLAGHEVTDITDIHMDDVVITDSQINGGSTAGGNVTAGTFGPKDSTTICTINKYLGLTSQTADSLLTNAFANYTSAHRGDGIAYLSMKWVLNDDSAETWDKFAPSNVKALVKGKPVYDPRLDTGAPNYNPLNQLFITYNATAGSYVGQGQNPALVLADYLISDLGMGISPSKIEWSSFITAANGCDVLVNVPNSQTEKRFTCNGVLFATDSHQKNINKILSSMNGNLVYSNGKYIVHAGIYEDETVANPFGTLNENDLIGAISVTTSLERSDRFNTIKGLFVDPNQNHKSSEFPKVQLADAVTRDNDEVLEKEVQYPMTNSSYMAQRLSFKLIKLSDQQKIISFPANLSALRITAGDRVKVSIEELSWSDKIFQCVGWNFSEEGGVNLTLREDSSSAYADPVPNANPALSEYSTVTATGVITDAFRGVPSPSGLTVTPGLKSNELNWVNPGKTNDFGTIYVYASRNENFSSAIKIGETDGTQFIHDGSNKSLIFFPSVVNLGDTYTIRTLGNTNFVAMGAASNTVGVVFTATATGTGTGNLWETLSPGDLRYYWVRAVKNVGTDAASRSNLEPNADPNTTVFATVGAVEVDWDNVADPTIGIDINNDTISINTGVANTTTGQAVATSGIEAGTTVTQGGITMNQGGSIKGGQGAYNSGTGFFLGYDTNAYKFSIGNSSTEALTFDGTNLAVTGNIAATSGSIGNSVTVGGTAASTVASEAAAGNQAADQISLLPRADDSEWTVGTGAKGIWNVNGGASENAVVVENGPHGELERIWKATSTDGSDADGGFQNTSTANMFPIESDTTYRFSVFIKQDNTNGTIYLGAYNFGGGSALSMYRYDGDSPTTNRYWFANNLPTQGEWYLLVGFINPSNTNSNSGKGGVYNLATGVKVTALDDFRFSGDGSETDATTFAVRTYNYYGAASPTSIVRWAHPRVDRLDRRAPSIAELLRGWTSLAEPINAGVTITGGGITMDSGGAIKGGQSAYNSGTGFFLGYDTNKYKFSIGNASNEALTFDGTNLAVTGAITATSGTFDGTVNASAGAFTGDVSTGAKFIAGSNSSTVTLDGTTGANYSIFAGADNSLDASFKVASDGVVEATRFIIRDDANGQVLIDTSNTANPFSGVVYTSISQGSGAGVDTVAGTLANNAGEITITTTQAETFLITAKVAIDDNDGSTNNISGASTVSTTDAENQLKGADLKIEYYLKEGAGAYALEDTEIVTFTEGTPLSSQIKVFGVDRGAGYSGSLTRYFAVIQGGGAAEFVTYFSTSSNANRARTYAVTTASISISGAGTHKIKILARLVDAGTNTTLTNSTTPALVNNNATGTYGGSGIVLDAAQSPPNQSSLDNFKRIYEATSANGFVVSAANTFAIGEGTTILTSGGTISGNLVITGDLTVQGTTTTINVADLTVADKDITLNYSTGDSSSTANNAGIIIQDAVSATADASILWKTATDRFEFSHAIYAPDAGVSGNSVWGGNNSGNARSLKIGYSGGEYGGAGYGITYTSTSGTQYYALADIPSKWTAYSGLVVYSADVGQVGNTVAWTEIFKAQKVGSSAYYKGNVILDASNYSTYAVPKAGGTFTGNVEIANASPVFILDDTNATTPTNQTSYISFQRQNAETAWIGYGSAGDDKFKLYNSEGPITIQGPTGGLNLDVIGNAKISQATTNTFLYINGGETSTGAQDREAGIIWQKGGSQKWETYVEASSNHYYKFYSYTGSQEVLQLRNDGNVLIPNGDLTLSSGSITATSDLFLRSAGGEAGIYLQDSSDSNATAFKIYADVTLATSTLYIDYDPSVLGSNWAFVNGGNFLASGTIYADGAASNSTQWKTGYDYSQVGHLPLTGGTLTGALAMGANTITSTGNVETKIIDQYQEFAAGNGDHEVQYFSKVLATYSENTASQTYIILTTTVPQSSFAMGGFQLTFWDKYATSTSGDVIDIYGYFSPESNSGFTGFRYNSKNPNFEPTIQVGANSSGYTVFILSNFGASDYAQLVAKDFWSGYTSTGAARSWGQGWSFSTSNSISAYTNLDTLGRNGVTSAQITNLSTAYNYSQVGHLPLSGGTITGNLATNGIVSSGAKKLSHGILDINTSSTPTQIKITTNITFAASAADFTVNIKGFAYGSAESVGITLHWHYYNSTFYNANMTNTGSWTPTVKLAVENDKVVIHLSPVPYWSKMYVESMYSSNYNNTFATGWSWADSAISSDSGTPTTTLSYKTRLGGTLSVAGATTLSGNATLNSNLSLGSGNSTGVLKLYTNDDASNYWDFYNWTDDSLRMNYNGLSSDEFILSNVGDLTIIGGITSGGVITATGGTLTGGLSGTTGTFSGAISGASFELSGISVIDSSQNINAASISTSGITSTGDIVLTTTLGTSPAVTFNTSTATDPGVDMAIRLDAAEGLSFYEPEDSNKVHFKILDDTGVDAPFGYWVNGTRMADASRNLTVGTISSGAITTSGPIRANSTDASTHASVSATWTSGAGMFMDYHPNPAIGYIDNTYDRSAVQTWGDIEIRQKVSGTMTTRLLFDNSAQNAQFSVPVISSGSVTSAGLTVNGNALIDGDLSLRSYQIPDSGGSYYGDYGYLNLFADTSFSSSSRQYALTNAYGVSKFAILYGDSSTTQPSLSTNGALATGTSLGLSISNAGKTYLQGLGIGLDQANWDTASLGLDVAYAANFRSYIYAGITTNTVGSWKTRQYANGSTHEINAQALVVNNTGYASPSVERLKAYAQGIRTTGALGAVTGSNPNAVIKAAHYAITSGTGSIVIQLPGSRSGNWSMPVIRVTTYEYKSAAANVYYIGGHNWTSGWYNNSVHHHGNNPEPVYLLGNATTNKSAIFIGSGSTSRSYLHVTVDVMSHPSFYDGSFDAMGTWSISLMTSSSGWSGTGNITETMLHSDVGTTGNYSVASLVSSGNITAYSDRKLKEDIQPLQNALATVMKLQGVQYTRKDSGEKDIGFVAQQVEEDCSEISERVVKTANKDEDIKGINYQNMVALLAEAIKEQQHQITTLTKIIEDLKDGNSKN